MGSNPVRTWIFFRRFFNYQFISARLILYLYLQPHCTYMIFIYLQPLLTLWGVSSQEKKKTASLEATKSKKVFVCELSCEWLKSAIFYLLFPSQSVEKLFPIISYDYLSQPTPSLGQREPAFSHRNHAQYCPSTADRVVCLFLNKDIHLERFPVFSRKILRNHRRPKLQLWDDNLAQ